MSSTDHGLAGPTRRALSTSPLRLGFLGCGFIGGIHLANTSRTAGVSVGAICDIDPDAAQDAHRRYGGGYWTTDSDRLVTDPDLDALLICTHVGSHAELAIAAMNAGKHVLVEKPMAASGQEARDMVTAAERAGVRLAVDLKFRFAGALQRARSAIAQPLLLFGQAAVAPLPASAPYRLGPDSLGIAEDLAPHVFDTLCYLSGSLPRTLYARATRHRRSDLAGCVAAVAGTLDFDSGAVASFAISDAGEWPYASRWFFEATDGDVRAVITDHCRKALIYSGTQEPSRNEPEVFSEDVQPHEVGTAAVLADFASSIAEQRDPVASTKEGLRSVLLVEALRQAVSSEEKVALSLAPPMTRER